MRPLRTSDLTSAVPVGGRGHRLPATLDAIAQRDDLLREATRRHCAGMSNREAARHLRSALLRYQRRMAARASRDDVRVEPRSIGLADLLEGGG